MIKVYFVSGSDKKVDMYDPNTSIKSCIESNGGSVERGQWSVNGHTLRPGSLDVSFAALGITDGDVYLTNFAKQDNN